MKRRSSVSTSLWIWLAPGGLGASCGVAGGGGVGRSAQLSKLVRSEMEASAKILKEAGIKPP